jgi:NAD(P)-dependent dehydrogenase (short-subunit alcohol dehydrogenase family)
VAKPLTGRVALVAGATRGAGRGIAVALGEAGATVYCTGRSVRSMPRNPRPPGAHPFDLDGRPETIDETAELVTEAGGEGIAVRTDHTDETQVRGLVERIERYHRRLDVLVNDVWGGDALTEWGTRFFELDLAKGRTMLERGLLSHIVTSRYAARLLRRYRRGLIVEITDGAAFDYRGTVFYDLVKMGTIRLAFAMAEELRDDGVAAVALTPGFLRSEAMLEHFGVTEANWREAGRDDPHFLHSESPLFVGRAVAALAADPDVMTLSGRVLSSWSLSRRYGFTDRDGSRPDWGAHAAGETFGADHRASHERFTAAAEVLPSGGEPPRADEAPEAGAPEAEVPADERGDADSDT